MLVKWSSANALELILAKLTFNYVFLRNHGDLSLGMETTLNSCDRQGNAASETEFFASRSMYGVLIKFVSAVWNGAKRSQSGTFQDNHVWYDWSIPINTLKWRNKISILPVFQDNTSFFLFFDNLLLSSTTCSEPSLIKVIDISICYSMRCLGFFKLIKVLLDCLRALCIFFV